MRPCVRDAATVVFVFLAACGGPLESSAQDDAVSSALAPLALSGAVAPFALQFSGTYLGSGSVSRLELRSDGRYVMTRNNHREQGHYSAARTRALPLSLRLGSRQARVAAYDGTLELESERLKLRRPPQSDEELCDASKGQWTDDDADPKTGLYCICPGATAFIPASGGCVSIR
jgi:hypothetical protein